MNSLNKNAPIYRILPFCLTIGCCILVIYFTVNARYLSYCTVVPQMKKVSQGKAIAGITVRTNPEVVFYVNLKDNNLNKDELFELGLSLTPVVDEYLPPITKKYGDVYVRVNIVIPPMQYLNMKFGYLFSGKFNIETEVFDWTYKGRD